MIKYPKISIIIPCYNQAQYLDECLQSVVDQTYQNWECIIVNDGSNDHIEDVAQKWLNTDQRFVYISQRNQGVSAARNKGIEISTGYYILPLDADDKINNDYIALAIQAFAENTNLKLVYCDAKKFGNESGHWNLKKFSLLRLSRDNMIFCSAIYKREDWESSGGYDINMKTGLEDWEFWISMLKDGGQVYKLNYIGFFYRVKLSSRQTDLTIEDKIPLFEYIIKKHADFYLKINQQLYKENNNLKLKLESEKFLINQLCKKTLGFKLFK